MFGSLAAKLQAKKQQQQQQQQASSTHGNEHSTMYLSRTQQQQQQQLLQPTQADTTGEGKKRQREEDEPIIAKTQSSTVAGGAVSTTHNTSLFLDEEAFECIRGKAQAEVEEILTTTVGVVQGTPPVAVQPSLSDVRIPKNVICTIVASGGLRCGVQPLHSLSDCLRTSESHDAAVPAPCDDATSALIDGLLVRSSSSNQKNASDRVSKRMYATQWLWVSLMRWRLAILRTCATHQVHAGEADKLPVDVVRRCGSRIAAQREAMREYSKAHAGTVRLMCALLVDAAAAASSSKQSPPPPSAPTTSGKAPQGNGSTILPDTITDGLYDVAVLADAAQYEASEGAYFQAVIGSEKWRLGLYSAGDMHMRHSLEKTQRDRVRHLLNNESAMASLHAVKRMVTLHQNSWTLFAA